MDCKEGTEKFGDKKTCLANAPVPPLTVDITAEEHDYCATIKDCAGLKLEPKNQKTNEGSQHGTVNLGSVLVSKYETCSVSDGTKHLNETEELQDDLEELSPDSQEHARIFVHHPSSIFPFNTSDYRFECICGELGLADYKARVQCLNCHLWQHAECVNYKEENLKIKPFYCPHCLVAMKPVPTGATLIISPSSICHQWVDEINRHVRSSSLRVLVRKKSCFIGKREIGEENYAIYYSGSALDL